MITTTLFRYKEIFDDRLEDTNLRIFRETLGEKIPPTDVAICTGVPNRITGDCPILTEENLNNSKLGLYPCFRFSDVSELVKDLGVTELKDYKSGIKRGIIYIPTNAYGESRKENKELLEKIEKGELREIDIKDAFFPTNECNSINDRLWNKYEKKENKYYVDQKGRVFLKIAVNPVHDRDRVLRMCELNNGVGYVPYEEEIVAEVKPVHIYIDLEEQVAALSVVPVSGIGGKDAIEKYLPELTKCIGDLQKVVKRENEKIEEIQRQKKEKQIRMYRRINKRLDELIKDVEKMGRESNNAETPGDNRIMESGDEIEGRD